MCLEANVGLLEQMRNERLQAMKGRYFGLWRSIVTNVNDPLGLGRIKAEVYARECHDDHQRELLGRTGFCRAGSQAVESGRRQGACRGRYPDVAQLPRGDGAGKASEDGART